MHRIQVPEGNNSFAATISIPHIEIRRRNTHRRPEETDTLLL